MRPANGARKNADHPGHTSDNSSMISNLLATWDSFCPMQLDMKTIEWQEDSGQLPLLSAKRCILGVPNLRCQTLRSKKDRRTGSSTASAPFCPRVFLLSVHPSGRWMVGAVGIEPTTFGLKGRCSTTELRPYGMNFSF